MQAFNYATLSNFKANTTSKQRIKQYTQKIQLQFKDRKKSQLFHTKVKNIQIYLFTNKKTKYLKWKFNLKMITLKIIDFLKHTLLKN